MSLKEKILVKTEVQEFLLKGAITPARVSEDQSVSNIFLRPKIKRLFLSDYKFEKIEPIHSIFALQNGRPKQSNGKNRSQRFLPQDSPASRNIEVCKVSMERKSILIPMSLFWSGTCSQDLHQTFKNPISILRRINIQLIIYLDDILIMRRGLEEILMSRDTVILLLQRLGFVINLQKSKLERNQIQNSNFWGWKSTYQRRK